MNQSDVYVHKKEKNCIYNDNLLLRCNFKEVLSNMRK